MDSQHNKQEGNVENFVDVAIVTTSGSYPDEGFAKVPTHQKIRVFLDKAASKLGIADTGNWVVRVNNNEIDPEKTYKECELLGEVEIDFGPREGGGGNA